MSTRAPTASTSNSPTQEDRPSKRRRTRTGIACDSCQRRKTRCEVLNGENAGCHRCHVLGTDCSLLPAPDEGQEPVRALGYDSATLKAIDDRTRGIEQALNKMMRGGGGNDGAVEIEKETPHFASRSGGIGPMVLRAFRQGTSSRWIDPVKLGLVSEKQLEQCVQQYFDQTALVFPVDSIRGLIEAHVDHPLVKTAILLYTMPHLRNRLHKILHADLAVADSTQPSLSICVAFLILSHIPQVKDELVAAIDVYSAATRGMGQAMAMGLDDIVHVVVQPGFDWTIERESVERLAALYSIAHRLAWTHAFNNPGFTHLSTVPPLITILPIAAALQLRSRLLLHLTLESILLTIMDPVIQANRRVRLERIFDEQSILALIHEFQTFQSKVASWREDVSFQNLSSSSFLLFHSYLVESLLALTFSGTYVPTPIMLVTRMEIVTIFGSELIAASLRLIDYILTSDLDLSLVPSFHLILALLPLGALVQSGKLHPDSEEVVSRQAKLEIYKEALKKAHPKLCLIVQELDQSDPPHDYSHYKQDTTIITPSSEEQSLDITFDQLFDMDSLWPMVQDWTQTM